MKSTLLNPLALVLCLAATNGWQSIYAAEPAEPVTRVDVHTVPVKRMTLHRYTTLYGNIIPGPANSQQPAASAQVSCAVGGVITRVSAIEGKQVLRNDLLVQLDEQQAEADLQRNQADLKLATARYERQKKLARLDDTSHKNIEKAEQQLAQARAALKQAQVNRALLDIRSPLDATVSRVLVRNGEIASAGMKMVELVNLQRLTAQVQAPEFVLDDIQTGLTAVVESTTLTTRGTVSFTGVSIDPSTGTAAIRITLPSKSGMHPGQFVRARIITETRPDSLVVPIKAVVKRTDGSSFVAITSGDEAELKPVKTGLAEGQWVEISGNDIHEGTSIVSREAYGLPEKAHINILRDTPETTNE